MTKRSVFEDVGGAKADRTAGPPAPMTRPGGKRKLVAAWLWLLLALVALMVLVGGLTRLTDSGLSITVWEPMMGAIPPLSAADWETAFEAYQTTTEFQEQNAWMTLEDFKPIYWWEWGHRFLGRLIGLVWAAGLGWLALLRAIPPGWLGRLVLPGVLGAAQGAIGWWMVASGVDRLDVASYRLAAHLGLAFLIFAVLLWLALRVRLEPVDEMKARRRRLSGPMAWAGGLIALVFLQVLSGALVAGIDAGRGYVDWPLMQGEVLPAEAFDLEPLWRNLFENPALVQFVHRMLGYLVLIAGLALAWRVGRAGHVGMRFWGRVVGAGVLVQVAIGIVTVLNAAPLGLAIAHQAGALVLVALIVRTRFEAAYPTEERIARGRPA